MNRMHIAIPTGLVVGAFVGLMIGGLWLQWHLGTNPNVAHSILECITR